MDQLDLFSAPLRGLEAKPSPGSSDPIAPGPATLSDADLLLAVAGAGLAAAVDYAGEIGRRRLEAGVPELVALCLRHAGYGRSRAVAEQTAALEAMVAIGSRAAAAAVSRLLERGVIEGPGVTQALTAAAALQAALPERVLRRHLRSDDPEQRRLAALCVQAAPRLSPHLVDLLEDLHEPVQVEAACALARLGRREGRAVLVAALHAVPTPSVVEAAAAIADAEIVVLLRRLATRQPDLAPSVTRALAGLDGEESGA